jgi:hypothetical protein
VTRQDACRERDPFDSQTRRSIGLGGPLRDSPYPFGGFPAGMDVNAAAAQAVLLACQSGASPPNTGLDAAKAGGANGSSGITTGGGQGETGGQSMEGATSMDVSNDPVTKPPSAGPDEDAITKSPSMEVEQAVVEGGAPPPAEQASDQGKAGGEGENKAGDGQGPGGQASMEVEVEGMTVQHLEELVATALAAGSFEGVVAYLEHGFQRSEVLNASFWPATQAVATPTPPAEGEPEPEPIRLDVAAVASFYRAIAKADQAMQVRPGDEAGIR